MSAEMIVYATRYALGRSSYAPNHVMHEIRAHAGELTEGDRTAIVRDISEALAHGDLPYRDEWIRTRNFLSGGAA